MAVLHGRIQTKIPHNKPTTTRDFNKPRNIECQESGCLECNLESGRLECWKSEWAYCCSWDCYQNPNGNGNVVAARAEGNAIGNNDGSAEVHHYDNFYNNDIFNMFTQQEQYTELLDPIPEPRQVNQNDSNVVSEVSSVEQGGGIGVFVSQTTKSREELDFSNTSKPVNVSKPISIPNEVFLDDTTPSVARKFLNEIHKITKDEIFPIVNQFDARLQNFKIQFLKEAAKFVRDFKSLAKEADESLAQHKALELEFECLLRVVVSQGIMFIVQSNSVVDTSNLQTELEPYNDMQQKIERLQAQLGDLKGKSKDTPCVSNTLDPLSQKLENKNVELEFQGLPKIGETHALLKPVTSNSVPTPQESKVVKNDNVIALGMFRINPFKPFREEKPMPNKVRASVKTKPFTVSQPYVITKKDVNSNSNCLSSTGVDNTAKTRRPHPRINIKNDMVPSTFKSSCSKNKEVEVEEHPRNLLLSKNKKHMSSECNNIKLAIQNDKSKVVCAMYKQCLITANHDVNYVNEMNSHGKSKRASHPPKPVPNSKQRLHLLYMDLSGLMRIASINRKRKPDISFLHVFAALCYPTNDREDIGKLSAKGDIDFFIGYSTGSCAYRIGGQPSATPRTILATRAPQVLQTPTTYTSIADTTPTPTNSSSQATNFPNTSHDVDELETQQQHVQQQNNQAPLKPEIVADNVPNAMLDGNTFVNPFATPSRSAAESSSS
ncbi:hypothetical protein Tco_1082646 [Tanacetum coccineum]|uniref:Integrase, catalytic region, zinc finger, CCHC-type, peptidase aspartic, catalytic n=1 Tax=Tanacetum coccineum TaxID=301880 RepID=A0ABQ5I101_9ASTR